MHRYGFVLVTAWALLIVGSADAFGQQPVFRMPLPIGVTSQCVQGESGTRSHNKPRTQYAIDFDTPNSGAAEPVVAAAAGTAYGFGGCTVGEIECNHRYGNHVKIDHGGGIYTIYAHLDSISIVNSSPVSAGDVIGTEGLTGYTDGDHVHFSVHSGDATILLPGNSIPIEQLEVIDTSPVDVASGRGYQVVAGSDLERFPIIRGHIRQRRSSFGTR